MAGVSGHSTPLHEAISCGLLCWAQPTIPMAKVSAREKRYYVYMMASSTGTLYTGMTNSIGRRSAEHKFGEGSQFTARYGVNRLVYYEAFHYVNNAIRREKQIKGWRRSRKIALIESQNPGWRDLSRDFGRQFQPAQIGGNRDSSLRSE